MNSLSKDGKRGRVMLYSKLDAMDAFNFGLTQQTQTVPEHPLQVSHPPANAPDTFLPQKNLNNWHSDRRRMDWQRENNWFAAISYF